MTLPFHPLADIFPLIEGAEREGLAVSIKVNGLRDAIVTLDGQVLDGRNRQRACEEAGVDCRYEPLPPDQDPLAFVIDKNLKRRHLNDDQRRMVAARLASLGRGRPTGNTADCGISRKEAAQLLSVDEAGVERARTVIAKAAPEVKAVVDTGKLTVAAAAQAAKLAPETQRKIAQEAEAGHANVVRTVIKKETRVVREVDLGAKQRSLPREKFGVILADPEWDRQVYSRDTGMDRHAANQYPVSSDEVIAKRDVASIAADDSVCGLWCTDPHRGVAVLEAWGFAPKSYFVWVKDIVELDVSPDLRWRLSIGARRILMTVGAAGTGFWCRDRDELLLIGTRGKPPCPAPGTQGESVWFAARPRDAKGKIIHSAKPECSLAWFDEHFPTMPKIELNQRGPARPGWKVWGLEAESSVSDLLPVPGDEVVAPIETPPVEAFESDPALLVAERSS
jgi:N6-adenosine-specific RNA methylase IME4/ParB-like chromosome segregation protein Spo0J